MYDEPPLDKFLSLHSGEEELRTQSLTLIANDADMRLHARIIECGQDLLYVLIHDEVHRDDDDLTVRLLGIRLFNACASCLKLLLSGYYQNAAFQMRDILETSFLLDYLQSDRALIRAWRQSDKKGRTAQFGPAKVRIALDDRDGFTERKREAHYNLLCELASHPTAMGFQMLRPDGVNAHCGPFLEPNAMKAVLSELAKIQVQAVGIFSLFIEWKTVAVAECKLAFMETQGLWFSRFFGRIGNDKLIDALRLDLETSRLPTASRMGSQ